MQNLHKGLDNANPSDLEAFVSNIQVGKSTNSYLWALHRYYAYSRNEGMRCFTADWRQRLIAKSRGKRRALKLIKIEGVDSELVAKLATLGISDVNQLLEIGSAKESRAQLASELGVPSLVILELVKMADLTRIVDIKGTRVRLLIDAGIDSVEKLAQYDPERLRSTISAFNLEKRIMKRNPTLVETTYRIKQAKKLPKIVEE